MASPRRVLAAANTSPPLPSSPDQVPASLAPELSPLPRSSGVEDILDGATDALKGEANAAMTGHLLMTRI